MVPSKAATHNAGQWVNPPGEGKNCHIFSRVAARPQLAGADPLPEIIAGSDN
jgi:hypothetical protein